ncbi:MAG: hypothetical protein GY854_23120 [Deltaproteobacteria bacterium]|nr:hypothetical protein [Deltaproteobacteria bacterium]
MISTTDLKPLSSLKLLKEISISCNVSWSHPDYIESDYESRESYDNGDKNPAGPSFGDEAVRTLGALSQLNKLQLNYCDVKSIEPLRNLKKLTELRVKILAQRAEFSGIQ